MKVYTTNQMFAAAAWMDEFYILIQREIECWRMFGIIAEWQFGDCLYVDLNLRGRG